MFELAKLGFRCSAKRIRRLARAAGLFCPCDIRAAR
jgi:hypothetical protein